MQPVFQQLLILMTVVWVVAVMLRRIGLPTIMGELVVGVVLGPAVLGWVEPSEVIEVLAQMGIFFLMLHTGVQTDPKEFFDAMKVSLGVAVVGALVPFAAALGVALAFGLETKTAVFVGLTMTATAVVITIKILNDLGLHNTRMARIIIAACVLDDLITLVMFSVVLGILREGGFDLATLGLIVVKVAFFFLVVVAVGYRLYPIFHHPFRSREGKGFAFVLVLGLGFGLFAELLGLHIVMGAYMAGLFFREEVASKELVQKVEDRLNGIAYTFLGPIFFISLGFHITFEGLSDAGIWLIIALTLAVGVSQIASAGGMARLLKFSWLECGVVGVGMCGRAEMAFVLSSLGMSLGVLDKATFSAIIFTTFLLNLLTPAGLKACAVSLHRRNARLGEPPPREALKVEDVTPKL